MSAVAVGNKPRRRLPPMVKTTFGVIAFVAVGLIIKGAISPTPPSQCTSNCSQPPKSAGGGTAYFTSSKFGFSFGYPSVGQRIKVGATSVVGYNFFDSTGNFAGQMLVDAGFGHPTLSYIIDNEAKALQSNISNMSLSGPLNGAEIGFTSGAGNLYTGDFTDSLGNVYPVRIGVLAVQHGNEWVAMIGMGAKSSSNPSPIVFSVYDDILDQWRWTG